ncbi:MULTISPECIES: hypothetical protein [unclassified Curtobacterium]|jgi:hypothetical protein|uniref:hypothetical protein n=1 Tax=unclassified Curtobacterium TaxID=257496 RepID=UPI0008DD74A0|nr:hypothetical protein [Curtobacterium sp. MCBA15_016]OII21214.1 hypothetical protein BIV03_15350 [Curtobacterium sp. MCBA15_016]
MRTKLVSLTTAAIAVALLAGCSAGDSGSDATTAAKSTPTQTKAEACKLFTNEVTDATKGMQMQLTELQSDPQAAMAKLDEFDATLEDSADKVTNTEVKPKTDAFAGAFSDFVGMTKDLAASKDPSALSSSGFTEGLQKLETTGKDFQEVCQS